MDEALLVAVALIMALSIIRQPSPPRSGYASAARRARARRDAVDLYDKHDLLRAGRCPHREKTI